MKKSAKKVDEDVRAAGWFPVKSVIFANNILVMHDGECIFRIQKDRNKRGVYWVDASDTRSNKMKAQSFADAYGYSIRLEH